MVTSSLSTYLDVTQPAEEAASKSAAGLDVAPEKAAQVLRAIHDGTNRVLDLPERTQLTASEVLEILGTLSRAGLVELTEHEGVLMVALTPPTTSAFSATK